jgi:hypothetical protein
MEKVKKSVFGRMKTLCSCFSAVAQQTREAEIDVPSKRRFRMMYASGNASSALPPDAGNGSRKWIARTGIGVRTFLDCLTVASHRAEQSETDVLVRRSYRKLHEPETGSTVRNDADLDMGEQGESSVSQEVGFVLRGS